MRVRPRLRLPGGEVDRLSEKRDELVHREACLTDDRAERPGLEVPIVHRHGQAADSVGVTEDGVAAGLVMHGEVRAPERRNGFARSQDGQRGQSISAR